MNEESDPLNSLLWIELPDDIDTHLGVFTLNPDIPLPVEADKNGSVNIEQLGWEQVIAAVLLVLANSPSHEHAEYYRSLLHAIRPNLEEELASAGENQLEDCQWETAQNLLLARLGLCPDSPDARLDMAGFYERHARWLRGQGNNREAETAEKTAETAYRELLCLDDAPAHAWFRTGMFRYRRGDFLLAAETLESFLEMEGSEEQRKEASRIVRLCRSDGQADSLYLKAYRALNEGRVSEGLALAREFRDSKPAGWPGWFLLGWALRLSEDFAEAREALEGARERGCREADLYNELAICTRALEDYDAAAAALEEALKLDPENIKIISNMAVLHMERNDKTEALRWLNTALTLQPDDPICLHLQKKMEKNP